MSDAQCTMNVIFGTKMRVARAIANLTMKDVATEVGISAQMICKYENGASIPRYKTLRALSRLYGVSIDWLMCDCPVTLTCQECDERAPD